MCKKEFVLTLSFSHKCTPPQNAQRFVWTIFWYNSWALPGQPHTGIATKATAEKDSKKG